MTLLANGALISFVFVDPAIAENDVALLGINAWALLVPAAVALLFMIRFVDHVPLITFGVGFHERWARDLGYGLSVAVLMLVFYDTFSVLLGEVRIEAAIHNAEFWTPWILTILILAVSAANEELLFRGYPFQVLMVAIGPWPAMILMSGLFGLGHALNPSATSLGTLNTFLAGILLCLAYVRTRSLWFPYGIHIGWNLAIGPIFGFSVSGITMESYWISASRGPEWLMGGAYGPEGGVLGTGVMLTAILAVLLTGKVGVSPELEAVLDEHADKIYARTPLGTAYAGSSKGQLP